MNNMNFQTINLPFNVNESQMDIEVLKTNILGVVESFKDKDFLDNKPGVYVFYDSQTLYIGESSQPMNRLKQHITSGKLKAKYQVLVFRSDKFNKSAIYDIETKLIDYFYAEDNFSLINEKTNQGKHRYYLEELYSQAIDEIWKYLLKEGISKYEIQDIEKQNIFKFSPFKDLNSDQQNVVDELKADKNTKITLVKGYPGTGKSIVASTLFYNLSQNSKVALVAGTKSIHSSFVEVFKKYLKSNTTGSKVVRAKDVINNEEKYDCIIIDEAHRLLKKGGKGMGAKYMHLGAGQNELDEMIKKTNQVVILYDENQKVHDGDFDFDESKYGFSKTLFLREQMRSSEGYKFINYIVSTLNGFSASYIQNEKYEVRVFENFADMYTKLKEKASTNNLVRLLSGYSRDWLSNPMKNKGSDDRPYDFDIDGIKLRWNTREENWVHSEPANNLEEVAYYTTIQGFDLTYSGVIIGKDIYLDDNDEIQVDEEYVKAVNQKPKKADLDYYKKLKGWTLNRYKILLSRASKGTYIYCEDKRLRDKLIKELKCNP